MGHMLLGLLGWEGFDVCCRSRFSFGLASSKPFPHGVSRAFTSLFSFQDAFRCADDPSGASLGVHQSAWQHLGVDQLVNINQRADDTCCFSPCRWGDEVERTFGLGRGEAAFP